MVFMEPAYHIIEYGYPYRCGVAGLARSRRRPGIRPRHDSVDFYLDGCRKDGEEPEKPFSGKFVVRLSPGTHRRATTLARIKDQSLNVVVVEALEEYLSAQGV